mgnify:CR=1 FL=1
MTTILTGDFEPEKAIDIIDLRNSNIYTAYVQKDLNNISNEKEEIEKELDGSKYIGRSVGQVDEFLSEIIAPVLARYPQEDIKAELNV